MKQMTTFLLIEDNTHDVFFIQQEFKRGAKNCRLNVVSDGIEAMRYLQGSHGYEDRAKHPLPDIILLDLKMPRFSGFEFLEWLRSKSPHHLHLLPVIVLSSSNLPQDVIRAYALGASSYLVKPAAWEEFRDRLRMLAAYWSQHVETPGVPPRPLNAKGLSTGSRAEPHVSAWSADL